MGRTTNTGKLPDNMGFPRVMSGVTRQLTKAELKQQERNLKTGNLI